MPHLKPLNWIHLLTLSILIFLILIIKNFDSSEINKVYLKLNMTKTNKYPW